MKHQSIMALHHDTYNSCHSVSRNLPHSIRIYYITKGNQIASLNGSEVLRTFIVRLGVHRKWRYNNHSMIFQRTSTKAKYYTFNNAYSYYHPPSFAPIFLYIDFVCYWETIYSMNYNIKQDVKSIFLQCYLFVWLCITLQLIILQLFHALYGNTNFYFNSRENFLVIV